MKCWKLLCLVSLVLASCYDYNDPKDFKRASFIANGFPQNFSTASGFTIFFGSNYDCDWSLTPLTQSFANDLAIWLPRNVTPGAVYTETSPAVMLAYVDSRGISYGGMSVPRSNPSTFTITITSWPGPGSYGMGTFSGVLLTDDGTSKVTITNGQFVGWIFN